MLNSSRDTLLDLEPMPASVLKLAVATVLTVASVAAMIAIFFLSCTQTMQFLLNHSNNLAYFPILLPIIPFFAHISRIIIDSFTHLLFSKLFPNN